MASRKPAAGGGPPAPAGGAGVGVGRGTQGVPDPKGNAFTAIRDVTFQVEPGRFCAVVGPTGCGKSTTLGLVSGLERPSEGEVQVMGEPVQGIDPRIGYVFQSDA